MRWEPPWSAISRALIVLAVSASPASAQLDPLQFMKTDPPNVIILVDVANRMQRDAPTDTSDIAHANATSTYYDPFIYTKSGAAWETGLGVTAVNTTTTYRRKYTNLTLSTSGNPDKFAAATIQVTGDKDATYATFGASTRLSVAKTAIYQAITENTRVTRFGLIQMRQKNPTPATQGNSGPVVDADPLQQTTETGSIVGRWNISRPSVAANNGAQSTSGLLVKADATTANSDILTVLAKDVRTSGALIPAGNDDANTVDAPVKFMLDDAKSEASRLIGINNDPPCRNTIVVMIVGGGEGTTAGLDNSSLGTAATSFLNISGRRVPIYVIALAPPSTDRAGLQAVATNSGGQYVEITKAQIDAALNAGATAFPSSLANAVIVPEVVSAIDAAVAHAFASSTDFNTAPSASLPLGGVTEFQVTSPIIGTVDLTNGFGLDQSGHIVQLANTVVNDKAGSPIPQRSNVMVTTGLAVPTANGMAGRLRAFRVYAPSRDDTQLSGWKFVSSGQRLWVACTPGPGCATAKGDAVTDPNTRNLYTVAADGTMLAFTTANAAALAPLMNLGVSDATAVITAVRNLPLGPIIDSTPAIMNPPSLDPPPDDDYPGFAVANKGRRSIVWVGSNWGILEAIDARLGVEVWGFIPVNLLPKLKTLRDGQSVGSFDFFVDGSAKIADVKIDGTWRTHLIIGEGPGGTFYQSFDVTMSDMASAVPSSSDDANAVLTYFSDPTKIKLNWAFPSYGDFDATIAPYGDLKATASAVEKSVGQTWSDPAVGQVVSTSGPYAVLIGSGFFPYSKQQNANRGGTVAGTTFYLLSAKTGAVYDSKNVGSDGINETVDDCRTNATGCRQIKNALQGDPVATGPSDSRFVTKTYMGDLDGNVWRFDIGLDPHANPIINATTKLYAAGSDQPIFSSMATVNVGGTQQYVFFGTGSDLLAGTDKNTVYHLLGVLDNGSTGTKTLDQTLAKNSQLTSDERVTAFPAVAGDIVFFTTTTFNQSSPCSAPNANLYALTFIGGAAYDNTGDNTVTNKDTPLVKTVAGQRATAPFVVDQHLVFAAGGNVQLFGDPQAYNNGVGQAGVRILSWREVR